MGEKPAKKLWMSSDKVLVNPEGAYEIDTLEDILSDAILEKLDANQLIVTTHEQRVENFDPNNPEWEKVKYNVSLKSLFDLYKEITGCEYKESTLDELQSKYRLGFQE